MFHFKNYNSDDEFKNEMYFLHRPCITRIANKKKGHFLGKATKAGDVAFYDGKNIKIVSLDTYKEDFSGKTDITPIGVVVVPNNHTPDETSRIMTLKNILYTGGFGEEKDGYDINYGTAGCLSVSKDKVNTISASSRTLVYSQYYGYSNYDKAVFSQNSVSYLEYDENGLKSREVLNNTDSLAFDLNGYENTQKLIKASDEHYVDYALANNGKINGWANSGAAGLTVFNHALMCYCFQTVGTRQKEWYLPSIGECQYINEKVVDINATILALGGHGIDYNRTSTISKYPFRGLTSSSLYDTKNLWCMYFDNPAFNSRETYSTGKNFTWLKVRAFRKVESTK